MARTFTAGTVIERARTLCDLRGASGLRRVTATEALRMCSSAWTWLHALLVKADQDYFEGTHTITTVGSATIPLPSDYFATKRVDYLTPSGGYERLKMITAADVELYEDPTTTVPYAEAFRLVASNLVLYGTPPSGQTYRHLYVPAAADLTSESDTIDGRAGWEQIVVLRVALLMRMQCDEDATAIEKELDAELQRVVACADERTLNDNSVIRDVECYGRRRRYPRAR